MKGFLLNLVELSAMRVFPEGAFGLSPPCLHPDKIADISKTEVMALIIIY